MRRKRNRIDEIKYPKSLQNDDFNKLVKLVKRAKPIKIDRYLDDLYDRVFIQQGVRLDNIVRLGMIDNTIEVHLHLSFSDLDTYVISEVGDNRYYTTNRVETAAKIVKSIMSDKREGMNAVKSATRVNLKDISSWY